MENKVENPYVKCPVLETGQFLFRLVEEGDAQDLLECYADPLAAKFFNSDNCTSDFVFRTVEEMQTCIGFWIAQYREGYYVRFSIVDQERKKAVGTIEFFAKEGRFEGFGRVGLLRLDLPSRYEREEIITQILLLVEEHFYEMFGVESILTKAIPEAEERRKALKKAGYWELEKNTIMAYGDYHATGPREF